MCSGISGVSGLFVLLRFHVFFICCVTLLHIVSRCISLTPLPSDACYAGFATNSVSLSHSFFLKKIQFVVYSINFDPCNIVCDVVSICMPIPVTMTMTMNCFHLFFMCFHHRFMRSFFMCVCVRERERERERERGGCFEFRHRQVKNGDQRNKCAMSSHCVIALLCANLSHAPPTRVLNNVDTLAWTLFTCRTCMQFSNIFYMNWILRYIYI